MEILELLNYCLLHLPQQVQLEQLNMCIACWSYILEVMEQMDTSHEEGMRT